MIQRKIGKLHTEMFVEMSEQKLLDKFPPRGTYKIQLPINQITERDIYLFHVSSPQSFKNKQQNNRVPIISIVDKHCTQYIGHLVNIIGPYL